MGKSYHWHIQSRSWCQLQALQGLVDDPDDNLSSYIVEVALQGTENWTTIIKGTTEVADGKVLGKFDPTFIDDGTYRVRLTATDTSGLSNSIEGDIDVISGNLKLGNFQLSFTDMAINVGSIPVQLTRSYDTLKVNSASSDLAPG